MAGAGRRPVGSECGTAVRLLLLTVLRLASDPSGYFGAKCFIAFCASACRQAGRQAG
jgi:hypothetical protein